MHHTDLGSIRKSREYVLMLENASKTKMGLKILGKDMIKMFETKVECEVDGELITFSVTQADVASVLPFL